MKKWRRLVARMAGIAIVVVLIAYFFGYTWRTQWDTRSAMECTVYRVFGIRIHAENPQETAVSKGRNIPVDQPEWKTVYSGPHWGKFVTPQHPKIAKMLSRLERLIPDPNDRSEFAKMMLEELKKNGHVQVLHRCARTYQALSSNYLTAKGDLPCLDLIRQVWAETAS